MNRIDEAAIEFRLRRDLNLERNLSSGLAGFEPLKLCELICMHTNLASDLEQHASSLDRVPIAPLIQRRFCRRHCAIDVGSVAA